MNKLHFSSKLFQSNSDSDSDSDNLTPSLEPLQPPLRPPRYSQLAAKSHTPSLRQSSSLNFKSRLSKHSPVFAPSASIGTSTSTLTPTPTPAYSRSSTPSSSTSTFNTNTARLSLQKIKNKLGNLSFSSSDNNHHRLSNSTSYNNINAKSNSKSNVAHLEPSLQSYLTQAQYSDSDLDVIPNINPNTHSNPSSPPHQTHDSLLVQGFEDLLHSTSSSSASTICSDDDSIIHPPPAQRSLPSSIDNEEYNEYTYNSASVNRASYEASPFYLFRMFFPFLQHYQTKI